MAKGEFERAGLNINCVYGGRYLEAYLGPREDLEEWVWPKVKEWTHEIRILAKIEKRYIQSESAGLEMLLQNKWQYLQRTGPWVGSLMGPI